MRLVLAVAILLSLSGCSDAKHQGTADAQTASRTGRCTERMLDGIHQGRSEQLRRYVEQTYCRRFARSGWVYANGTLSIKAHLSLMNGGRCAESSGNGPAVTVPCTPSYDPLECGILRFVRRAEAQAYIERVRRSHRVSCDDGTPLDELGAT